MAQPIVRVEGARELRAALKRAGLSLQDLKEVNAKVAALVAGLARPRTPRRTGRLAGTVRGNRAVSQAVVQAGTAAVPYAGPIHWGWPARHIEAQPWISDAAVESESQWLGLIQDGLEAIVDQVERQSL